jgi:aminoglycoside 6'-N-acetyltransferase I
MRAEPCPVNDGNCPRIEPCTLQSLEEWAALRHALWPEAPVQEHRSEAQAMLWEQKKAAAFLIVWMRDLLGGSDDLEGWRQRV